MDFFTHTLLTPDLCREPGFLLRQSDAARGAALFAAHGLVFALHYLAAPLALSFDSVSASLEDLPSFPGDPAFFAAKDFVPMPTAGGLVPILGGLREPLDFRLSIQSGFGLKLGDI